MRVSMHAAIGNQAKRHHGIGERHVDVTAIGARIQRAKHGVATDATERRERPGPR
jgi:hypothetical protein